LSRRAVRPAVWVCLLGLAAAGCGGPSDPVRQLLDDVAAAAADRDAGSVLARLAPSFRGTGGLDRAAAGAELRRYFALYSGLDVTLSEVEVEPEEHGARARFRADLSGRPKDLPGVEGLLPRASAFRFEVRAAPAEDGWAIVSADWERVELPAEP
jgi:hypothetical protein